MHRITFLIPLLALLIFTTSKADVPKLNLPFDEQIKLMDSHPLVLTHQDLQQLGDVLLTQPSGYSVKEKRELLVKICFVLGSTRFEGYRGGRHDSDQLARRILASDPQMDAEQKFDLITTFDWSRLNKSDMEGWARDRSERSGCVVALWNQLSTELKDFDPKPPESYFYPVGGMKQPGATGVGRTANDDGELPLYRQRREKFVEDYLNFKNLKELSSIAENNLGSAFSTPPYNLPELQQLLEPIDPKNEVKQRILSRVTKAIGTRIEGVPKDPYPPLKPAIQEHRPSS